MEKSFPGRSWWMFVLPGPSPDPQSVLARVQMLCQQEKLKRERAESCNFRARLAPMSKQASRSFAASANHRFELEKRRQLFIRTHNETLSVAAMCVRNPNCSPLAIHG
jgi:hypothetical protein